MGAINKTWNTSNPETEHEHHLSNPKKKKFLVRACILLVIGLIVSGFMYSNVQNQKAEIKKIKEKRMKLENDYKQLTKEKKFLENEIKKLNDDEYILKIARRDFFFSKEGELIFPVESR
ncbi:MAG: septum formation initiator family protein [Bacillaceae bacterium]